jgi:hypothetical protein
MPDKKIIYINQPQLNHPSLVSILEDHPQHDWKALLKYSQHNAGADTLYCRYGKNTFPLNTTVNLPDWTTPVYNPDFKKTWADITNQRCVDLWKTHSQSPWLIYWSGGVDSTTILTSILQNILPQDFSNIHVACNFSSICENPEFFYKHVKPNFKLLDSSELLFNQELLNSYYIIDGEPADQLFAGSTAQELVLMNGNALTQDIRKSPDQLLTYLTQRVDSHFANWFYEHLLENINSVDVPINTYHDFFWWSYFNLIWISVKFRSLYFEQFSDQQGLQLYLNKFVNWFDTVDYQLWSMCNNHYDIKYGNNIGDYKLVAKQYIHAFDHNDYYLKFKLKTASVSRVVYQKNWFCILDDLTRLNLNDDLEQILELLPAHIC